MVSNADKKQIREFLDEYLEEVSSSSVAPLAPENMISISSLKKKEEDK
jgi:hypothetical protein